MMRLLGLPLVALVLVALVLLSAGCASPAATGSGATQAPHNVDAAAVRADLQAFLEHQAADWTAGDLEGFCAVYAEDAVFISPSGKTVGRQAIFDRYTQRYREGGAEMGALTLAIEDVRLSAGGSMASIAMRWTLVWQGKDPATGLSLISLVRRSPSGGEGPTWQIVQDASM